MANTSISKSHPKSWFETMHANSNRSHEMFCSGSTIVVLQVMPIDEGWLVVELVARKDYDCEV